LKDFFSENIFKIIALNLKVNKNCPFRTSDHELLAYEVFCYYERLSKDQLKIRFKKVKHGLVLRERKAK
jgi:hypothetical protein